jgi:transposase
MIARGGPCFLRLCSYVQQTTVQPWTTRVIQQGSTVNTDEYSIYARLPTWGYIHVTVNHSAGEYARDADGDGVNEMHVNIMEGL